MDRQRELEGLIAEQRADMKLRDYALPEKIDGEKTEGYGVFLPWESEADGIESGSNGYLVARNVRASVPWRPSLVRLDERPHVEHAAKVKGDPHAALKEARTSLKGRKGKSRQLLKRRIARLETTVRLFDAERQWPEMPAEPDVQPESTSRIPRPTQADYLGWLGAGR